MSRIATLILVAFALTAGLALADQFVGWVTDEKCAAAGKQADKKCVEPGSTLVFVNEADKKMYRIEDQDKAKEHVGAKVVLQGTATGDQIKIQAINPSRQ